MTPAYTLVVPDASPIITLAAADALDVLLKPGIAVVIPDGLHWETVRFPQKLGAADIVRWLRRSRPEVVIEATQEFADAQLLVEAGRKRVAGLGERCALEVVNLLTDQGGSAKAILLYEDSDVLGMRIVRPERVDTLTTADFLFALEATRLIQSADNILDRAIAAGRDEGVRARGPHPPTATFGGEGSG